MSGPLVSFVVMKLFALLCGLGLLTIGLGCRQFPADTTANAEVACGQCQFGLAGTNCDLAVRIAGRAYFVSGYHIDQFGDAHATNGFCNAIRPAHVVGSLEKDRFVAKRIELR